MRQFAKLAQRSGYELIPKEHLQALVDERRLEADRKPTEEDLRRVKLLGGRGVDLLLDVGANIGQFAIRTRRAGYGGRIVSFEPLAGPFAELSAASESDPEWEVRQFALGAQDGEAEINVSRNTFSSSMLGISERHVKSAPESEYVATETIPVAELDSIWAELVKPAERPFLKIDVQGFELEVMRGAKRALAELAGVQVELSLVPLYEGAPNYKEVIAHLEQAGFRLAGLEPEFADPDTGELLQANAIFIADDGS